jgi:hypothetical protein
LDILVSVYERIERWPYFDPYEPFLREFTDRAFDSRYLTDWFLHNHKQLLIGYVLRRVRWKAVLEKHSNEMYLTDYSMLQNELGRGNWSY